MPATKTFHLSAILGVTTGRLLGDIGDIYEIVNHLTGDSISTIGLLAANDPCKAALLAQHPQLAGIDASSVNEQTWRSWLSEQVATYGATLPVAPMASWTKRTVVDDILDVNRLNPSAEVLVVEP